LYQDAVRFLAFKLPPDAGVKWAIGCIKELRAPESQKEKDEPLDASDAVDQGAGRPDHDLPPKEAGDKATKAGESKLVAMAVFHERGQPGARRELRRLRRRNMPRRK
jgi:hypothetical protein